MTEFVDGLLKPGEEPPVARNWQVTRFCCSSGMCIRCKAVGNLKRRVRMVHADRVTKDWAERCAANWNREYRGAYDAIAERMPSCSHD